ncbi:MAG: hypothetical protein HRT47_07795 [Candidatus Caenarcaniphilales bacterium]|nr:hypothetical protein [Candidatus Caenarcaniphilales bacterium]
MSLTSTNIKLLPPEIPQASLGAASVYNLPENKRNAPEANDHSLKCEYIEPGFPCTVFPKINSKKIIKDSESFASLSYNDLSRSGDLAIAGDNPEERALGKILRNIKVRALLENYSGSNTKVKLRKLVRNLSLDTIDSHRDKHISSQLFRVIKDYFPFEDGKFLKRDSGFKRSAELYLNNLKDYQPYLYELANRSSKQFAAKYADKDINTIVSISAHSSESNLKNTLKELNEIFPNGESGSVFLFLNGQNTKELNQRLEELQEFKKDNPEFDLNVISAVVPEWVNGFKAIPTLTGLMTKNKVSDKDADVPLVFFDSDIIKIENKNEIKNDINAVKNGAIVTEQYHFNIDNKRDALKEFCKDDLDVQALRKFTDILNALYRGLIIDDHDKQELGYDLDEEKFNYGIEASGGYSVCSSMLHMLCGGISPHVSNEDTDHHTRETSRLALATKSNFSSFENFRDAAIANKNRPRISFDDDGVSRIIKNQQPIYQQWHSHDGMKGSLYDIFQSSDKHKDTITSPAFEYLAHRFLPELRASMSKALDINSKYFLKMSGGKKSWDSNYDEIFKKKLEVFNKDINKLIKSLDPDFPLVEVLLCSLEGEDDKRYLFLKVYEKGLRDGMVKGDLIDSTIHLKYEGKEVLVD